MIRILVSGEPLTFNKGCMGMVIGLHQGLKEQFPGPYEITVLSSKFYASDKAMYERYDGIKVDRLPWMAPNIRKRHYAKELLLLAMSLLGFKTPYDKAFQSYDAIVDLNGDSLTEDYGLFQLLRRLLPLQIGIRNRIPVFVCAQTLGPFKSPLGRALARYVLKRVDKLAAREDISSAYCESIGIGNVIRTGDMALLQRSRPVDDAGLRAHLEWMTRHPTIGLSVSSLMKSWAASSMTKSYIECMAEIAEHLTVEHGYHIITIPHVIRPYQDDRSAAREMMSLLSPEARGKVKLLEEDLPSDQLKFLISRCRVLIASRMHAAIAGMTQQVPTICIATGNKFHGLVGKRLKQEDCILDFKRMTYEQIVNECVRKAVMMERNKEQIGRQLEREVHRERLRALENIRFLLQMTRQKEAVSP
ncbi:hypothetical protein GE107_13765 [Cohnella sp. CFH 77786]|uniref:polysaccharide pyruvyl transferase family protein n=1 Tax=Cohnella sp. CFH 77786 TaxID=2662265 RepID=UPI001C60A11F|nr:polysaccharide pyruvyl transferase family protein [Cohnella sp. CFH 77786]MBW5447125.1 hypothetical protein [Cohnella sp. CFH 77786]